MIDAALAWSFGDPQVAGSGTLDTHADYVFRFPIELEIPGAIEAYVGAGGKVRFRAQIEVGGRIPVGVRYLIEGFPLEVFLELGPGLLLFPATSLDMGGGIGVRFLI